MRYEIPVAITFAVGLLMVLSGFVVVPYLNFAVCEDQNYSMIVSAFALGVGAINLVFMHGRNIRSGQTQYIAWCLLQGFLSCFLWE